MSKLTFRESFKWEEYVETFVRERIQGKSLNIPCGKSKIGDVRIDIAPFDGNDIGDMYHIPYPCETFDTVISDPPWKIPYYDRIKLFFECVYVCKVGGRIIYNATWIPESKATQINEMYVRQSSSYANASLLMTFTKTTDSINIQTDQENERNKPKHISMKVHLGMKNPSHRN